jgi:putative heme iron utilization protein
MDFDTLQSIRHLLRDVRVLSLAVVVDGEAEAALLPFAASADCSAVYVQASGLARHARGLVSGASVGILIHEAVTPPMDPMQVPRLSIRAVVTILERDAPTFAAARDRFVARFPAAAITLELGDFNLYELGLGRGRYVEGFPRAFNVGAETFQELAGL